MLHLVIAVLATIAIITMAILANVDTYRYAPVFLVPGLWAIFVLRRRLNLAAVHYALVASAILLHMLGSFGFYQRWPLPISFDIVVHYWFAVVVTLALYQALKGNYPLSRRHLLVLSFMLMMGLASLHEIMEYCSYLLLGEEKGMLKPSTSYFFDTQRDMVNNLLGAITALLIVTTSGSRRSKGNSRVQSELEAS